VKRATAADVCKTFVWGSNSSHQLALGTQEKFLQAQFSSAFSDVQQVWLFVSLVIRIRIELFSFF
jgi:hypothetical protein